MQSRHVKALLKYISCRMFLKFQKHIRFYKINIGCNGTEKNPTLSQEPVNHIPIDKLKILYKLVKVGNLVIHDYGTFSYNKLFEHA